MSNGTPGRHPLPWQDAFYNEHLSPRLTYGLAEMIRRGGLQAIRKSGLPGTGMARSDEPVHSRQDRLRLTRGAINGRPIKRP